MKSKKTTEKDNKKAKKDKKEEKEEMSVDDAFADDEDVEYAKSKPRKEKKKDNNGLDEKELEDEIEEAEEEEENISSAMNGPAEVEREITFKTSKPVSNVKKGDKIKIDEIEYEVDEHYVLIDHGTTKEMVIEIFNPKTDKDFQLRYFSDQLENTLDFYELQEILYVKKPFKKIEW